MDKERYENTLKAIAEQISELSKVREQARKEFIEATAEFKVGDKVKVYTSSWRSSKDEFKAEAFISSVADPYFNGTIRYEFNKIKKDGTMSGSSAGIYSYSRLEKVS